MSDRMELLDLSPSVTETDVVLALIEHSVEMAQHGASVLPVDQFWREGDLGRYNAASAWWPTDAPPNCQLPSLRELCMTIAGGAGTTPMPFMSAVTVIWQRCVQWLESEGRSTVHPNETKDERRRRLGREAVARHRALNATSGGNPDADRVKSLYARYIAACQARKAAAAEHDDRVASARAEWEAAKAAL
jgi:hypothetical protein